MTSLLRAVLGASFGASRTIPIVPPDPDRPARLDAEVSIVATSDDEWTITLGVPAYSLIDHNLLAETRAYLVQEGHGLPSSAADWVATSYPYVSVDLSTTLEGATIVVPLSEVPEGKYFGQLVKFYDDSTMPPSNPPSVPSDEPPADPVTLPSDQPAEAVVGEQTA